MLFQPWGRPMWDENDHNNIMFLTMCFFWHWAAAAAILAVNYTLTYWYSWDRSWGRNWGRAGVGRQGGMSAVRHRCTPALPAVRSHS